jgi:sugar transferase EpsL
MTNIAKRLFDLVLSTILAIGAAPVAGAVALALWCTQGTVIFRQIRPGLYARPFVLYKFCSMNSARDKYGELLPDEQRLTHIGSLVRSLSLDELPQLWNVFKGDMSLVGPRPLLMEYLVRYSTEQSRRHHVRPGITGWAQVHGRNSLGWDERFALDVWYVDNRSLWLDLKILWMTAFLVIRRSGISSPGQATMERFMGSRGEVQPPDGTGAHTLD